MLWLLGYIIPVAFISTSVALTIWPTKKDPD